MTKKMLQWWSILASVLVLLCMFSTATPQTLDSNALRQISSLLGLPVGKGDSSTREEDLPDFVKDIHECWNSNNSNDCLPGYHGTDVNQLRASLGVSGKCQKHNNSASSLISLPVFPAENQTTLPTALHSYNKMRELKNSLAISFNVSLTGGQGDIVRYAMLRVYREPVELALLQENCSNLSDLSLQLYTQTSMEGENPVFTLRGVQSLSQANFTQGEWVEFLNLTSVYRTLIETAQEDLEEGALATGVLNTRLTVNSPSCSHLSPSALGFVSIAKHRAQLVGFEVNTIENRARFSDMMTLIARFRRSPDRSPRAIPLSTAAPSNRTSTTSTAIPAIPSPPPLPSNPEDHGCRLYSHHVSVCVMVGAMCNYSLFHSGAFRDIRMVSSLRGRACIWQPNSLP